MSPTLHHFGSAAEGRVPQSGTIAEVSIMGKSSSGAASILAGSIGRGVTVTGHIDLTQAAIDANAAHSVKATPGGGLRADGTENVRYNYDPEKTVELFGARQDSLGSSKPSMG